MGGRKNNKSNDNEINNYIGLIHTKFELKKNDAQAKNRTLHCRVRRQTHYLHTTGTLLMSVYFYVI